MKARIVKVKSDCVLSVGMIVKNEEKYLDRCLTALKPLLDAVPSELVIVDTGSTDNTVEIAKRHTDKVYFFEWVNDFAAARNYGLDRCRGEWFMFLDADEIFEEDVSEMVGFFNDEDLREKYGRGSFVIRNFTGIGEAVNKVEFVNPRIARRFDGLRFVGPIHELLNSGGHCRNFKTVANHYGYQYESMEEKEKKSQRNLELLYSELEKEPDNIRVRVHILRDIAESEKEEFFTETIKKAREQKQAAYSPVVFLMAMQYYLTKAKYDAALRYVDEYFKIYTKKDALLLDVYVCQGTCYQAQGKKEEALAAFDRYFKYYKLYAEGKLDDSPMMLTTVVFHNPEEYQKVLVVCNSILSGENRMIAVDSGYSGVVVKVEPLSKERMLAAKAAHCAEIIESGEYDKAKGYISENFLGLDAEAIAEAAYAISSRFYNNADAVLNYCDPEYFSGDMSGLLWAMTAYERAAVGRTDGSPQTELLRERLSYFAALYTANLYNPALLNETDITALPEMHRFGYYAALTRNGAEFDIETAVFDCPPYADIIRRKI